MSHKNIKDYVYCDEDSSILGKGKFGTVYLGWKKDQTNEKVAIKIIERSKINTPKLAELFQQEISVMKQLQKSENIVTLIEFTKTQKYCNNGDLQQLLKTKQQFSESDAIIHFKQILNGFNNMHKQSVIHRDFKAANVLIKDGVFKIGDFSFAKQLKENNMAETWLGTSQYMAPEILGKQKYNYKTDIWAIGVTFYKMLFGSLPFKGDSPEQIQQNQNKKIDFKKNGIIISEETQNLIKSMLTLNPEDRISWFDLFNHPALNLKQIEEKSDGESQRIYSVDIDLKIQSNFYKNNAIFQELKEKDFEDLLTDFKSQQSQVQVKINQSNLILQQQQEITIIDEIYVLNRKYKHKKNILKQIGFIIELMQREQQHQQYPVIISVLWAIYIQKLEYLNESLIKKINIFDSEYIDYFFQSKYGQKWRENISLKYTNKMIIFDRILDKQQQANNKNELLLASNQKSKLTDYILLLFKEINELQSQKQPIINKLSLIYYIEDILLIDNVYQYNFIHPVTQEQREFNFKKYNKNISSLTIEDYFAKTTGRLLELKSI